MTEGGGQMGALKMREYFVQRTWQIHLSTPSDKESNQSNTPIRWVCEDISRKEELSPERVALLVVDYT